MLTTAQIKHLQSLKLKKYRQNYDEFIIEGDKLITEALLGNAEMRLLIATEPWYHSHSNDLPSSLQVEIVKQKDLDKISSLSTTPEVMGLVKQYSLQIDTVSVDQKWILVLDGIHDPGNLGTIIRTADWFGIDTIICSENCVDAYNPKVVQSAMGSLFRVKVVYTHLADFLQAHKASTFGATLDGENVNQVAFPTAGILVIGSESHGISEEVMQLMDKKITIPKLGSTESLNAAIANAIILSKIFTV